MSLGPVMLDIEGLSLSPADRVLLREPAVGGVILFTRNYESVEQVTDLVAEIRALRSPPLLVAVDHEGGRVQRFREGFTRIPPMRRIGREFDRDPDAGLRAAREAGWLIASELRAAGIDLCFAPCVDLDWGVSEIIGNRAFHRKPGVVADLANAFARGLRSAGMAAVAKHFPGHGAVLADSHLKLPIDRRDYGLILDDMRPYERLGFGGAVFCDDLSMEAARDYGSMAERARRALDAGCDMILVCNDREAAHEAVDALGSWSNPLSLVRLARLHGTGHPLRETLLASEEWQAVNERFSHWSDRPEFHLDA